MRAKATLTQSLIPVLFLILLLSFNVLIFKDEATSGANQFALILSGGMAMLIGGYNKVRLSVMTEAVSENIKSVVPAILILFMVGALAGTWLISGIIPAMIYYGLSMLNPKIFLLACVFICIVVSMATGSSWTTSATVGIALIGIGESLGVDNNITAGAVLSGAYFGDKMSILSDTTNLAPAMAGTDVYTHVKYMLITTVPTLIITLIFFGFMGFYIDTSGATHPEVAMQLIGKSFHITPWLFVVPATVICLVFIKVEPLPALMTGTLLGALFAVVFQQELLTSISGVSHSTPQEIYRVIITAITGETSIPVETIILENGTQIDFSSLFQQDGMLGMMSTVWLIISAMVFGGAMDAIGALQRISDFFLKLFSSIFGLFASTVASCLTLNLTASDQYLAIVVPGKMFKEAYKDRGLAPENLSRTLEDSATVTSVLVPWNTGGAYQSKVLLGQSGLTGYIPYAVFNYMSPFVTLVVAAIGYKIRRVKSQSQ